MCESRAQIGQEMRCYVASCIVYGSVRVYYKMSLYTKPPALISGGFWVVEIERPRRLVPVGAGGDEGGGQEREKVREMM